jgi:hypothetical protein
VFGFISSGSIRIELAGRAVVSIESGVEASLGIKSLSKCCLDTAKTKCFATILGHVCN